MLFVLQKELTLQINNYKMDISANYDTYLEYLNQYIDLFRIELTKQGYNKEISDYEIESNWMQCDIELAVKEFIHFKNKNMK